MTHTFDSNIAKQIGVNAAVLFNYFSFWIAKNEANKSNYHNGHYWTYNSVKALQELFPYMTARQIGTAIKKLIDEGLVIKDNFNTDKYNHTLWYAITDKGKAIIHQSQVDYTPKSSRIDTDVKCTNTVDNTVDNTVREGATSRFTPPTARQVHDYCQEKGYHIDIEHFISYYQSNGWKVGKNKMKDWKAAVVTWVKNDKKYGNIESKPKEEPKVYAHPFDDGSDPEYTRRALEAQKRRGW